MSSSGRRAQAGETVILDMSDGKTTFVKLKERGSSAKVAKTVVSLDALIEQEYGSLFEVTADDRQLKRVKRPAETECLDWVASVGIDRNNSQLEDAGAAHQQLSAADIQALRQSGRTGEEIVSALLQNSATYSGKTQFSQEKYRRKKAKKYVQQITLRQATARSICEAYFAKTPSKIHWLRGDTLAILLTLANIGPHAQVLLIDATGGLVTGAVAERMGGHGSITVAHTGSRAEPSDLVDKFNLAPECKRAIRRMHINDLSDVLRESTEPGASAAATYQSSTGPGNTANGHQAASKSSDIGVQAQHVMPATATPSAQPLVSPAQPAEAPIQQQARSYPAGPAQVPSSSPQMAGSPLQNGLAHPIDTEMASPAVSAETITEQIQRGLESTGPAQPSQQEPAADGIQMQAAANGAVAPLEGPGAPPKSIMDDALRQRVRQGFNCCILAAPTARSEALFDKALPLLAPSAAFVAYSNWSQPLAEAMMQLQVSKKAVALQLQESWLREQQVLPGRTHPHMTMSATGGFILSGIKIVV